MENSALTISGRYNHTGIQNIDRLPPATVAGSRGSLNGQSDYQRFNPAIGLTYGLEKYASVYASYSEASRAPTSIELGCADANDPCNLPNALVSDPPLKQVVARTVEAGIRSAGEGALRWNIGWFFAENHNDLLFVASQQTGFGYFTNFGQTRRDGVDISVSGKIHRLMLGGNYTRLSADVSKLNKPWTAAATHSATVDWEWTATSPSTPATASRRSRVIFSRLMQISTLCRNCRLTWTSTP